MDSSTPAQDLAGAIQAAASPSQIAAAISAVSSFLRRHPSDQSRPFFSLAFPSLLQRIFGFDSISWLELATSDPDLSFNLFSFLGPHGPLFTSIFSVDQQSLIKYIFPSERLPEWIRFVLQNPISGDLLASASPLFASRIKEDEIQNLNQIQLNVFEYYIFWFAYYPVLRGAASDLSGPNSGPSRPNRKLENWVSSLPFISTTGRKPGQKPESSLYLKLLYSYLKAFVPKIGLIPYRSSMLSYSINSDKTYVQAEFVINTLLQFWLVDNDFSPLPVQEYQKLGFSFQNWIGKNPPTPGLAEPIKLLVNYLAFNTNSSEENNAHKVFDEMIKRPLYRFILRSFLYCPIGASLKNANQVFNLWISYIEPWKLCEEDFNEFEMSKENGVEGKRNKEDLWMDYVLDNYLFYSSMVVHFLEFTHKFIHSDVVSVVQMVSKILDVLCSSNELASLLRQVDITYRVRKTGSPSNYSLDKLYNKYIPSICEQLKDWEDGLSESETEVPFLNERKDLDLRLFSQGEDGAHNLLHLLVIHAEHEIHLLPGDFSKLLQTLDSIKSRIKQLFRDQIAKTQAKSPPQKINKKPTNQTEFFTPRRPKQGNKYRGDWMRRPISTDEVAWLARVLIRVSDWLNCYLALDRNVESNNNADVAGLTFVELKGDEVRQINGFKEAFWLLFTHVFSWFVVICNLVLGFMRRRGMRVNLRVLASKMLVGVVLLCIFLMVISRVFTKVLGLFGFS
ncbi:hypothetical protein LUZ60_014420 [Juncus effusus]|nr:hypothetical protein LUZ60_014420 [Juncus effusus]